MSTITEKLDGEKENNLEKVDSAISSDLKHDLLTTSGKVNLLYCASRLFYFISVANHFSLSSSILL